MLQQRKGLKLTSMFQKTDFGTEFFRKILVSQSISCLKVIMIFNTVFPLISAPVAYLISKL